MKEYTTIRSKWELLKGNQIHSEDSVSEFSDEPGTVLARKVVPE